MEVHPGPEKRRVPEAQAAELDPIRRALHDNEDWYQDLVEHSQDLLCIHDLQGRLLLVNSVPARVLGYSVEEILQIPMRHLIAPEFRDQFDAYMSRIERLGAASGLLAVVTRSGERRIWEYHNTLRTEGVASPIVRGIAHDVTEQKRSEKLLREAGEELLAKVREGERTIRELKLFRTLVDQSNDAIEVVDPETLRFIDVNEKACLELGYSREEFLSLRVFDINPAATESSVEKIREELRKSGSHVMESVHRRKDGSTFPVEISLRRVQLERNYVVNIVRNLTEHKRVEEALRKSEDKFSKAFRQSPMALTITSIKDHRYIEVNETFESMTGWRRDEIQGRTPFDIGLWVNPGERLEIATRLLAEGSLREREASFRMRDGSIRNCLITAEVIELNGEPCAIGVAADVTERKQAEARLREYERVVEGLEENVAVVDRNFVYLLANRAFLEHRRLTKEQVVGHSVSEVLKDEQLFEKVIKPGFDECLSGKIIHFELRKRYPHVGERDVFVSYLPIEGPTGVDRIAIVLQDITERKQAEERLREYERVVESLEEIIVVVDREYRYVIANREFLKRRGQKREQLLGRTVMDQLDLEGMSREALALVKEKMDECFQGKVVEYELIYQYPTLGPRNLFLSYFPIEGPTGIDRIACVLRDVTERKRAEEALRQNLAQLQEVTEELRLAKEKLSEEKLYLEESIDTELGFGEIIGRSSALKEVMEKVAKVAPSDATVLLLGETGTGKELVARALHRLSKRQGKSFIKVNCAAIPSGLLESELFGHEKGAFTGAVARKAGRLELADGGTLFLDEIGEIPLSLQPKLLRVLQDMEFERLGGTQTLKVNFRLLAATNRNLLQSVREHEFRSDLFYRLNVFPIHIPPLRERREDIRPLVEHFVRKFATQMKKSVASIPSKTMEMLVRWDWPGNIRELENFVERSVILTPGSVLQSPLSELTALEESGSKTASLRDKERERILGVLRECRGKLGGPDGAAARLGLKRTTLQSKLDQLGIKPGMYRK
ncbi:MAG: PAS domain S-box protein [Candidatus Sulfotelmatobacter sp.]|jgi:PAS domain S-box-containing protein